jgi:hypothetical protein
MTDAAVADLTYDQYAFWRRRLAGETVPIHDGEVHPGFYRLKDRAGADQPVAYWFGKDGALRCRIGGKDVDEQVARERWVWAQKLPITHDLYKEITAGGHWPDQHEAVTQSNRAPDDNSLEGIRDAIDALATEAKALIDKGAAKSEDEVNRAADLANRLGQLHSKADKAREAEKAPHLKAGREVDDKWRPLTASAEVYKKIKAAVITPFLAAQQAAKEKAEREAREAADRARREAEAREAAAREAAERAEREGNAEAVAKTKEDAERAKIMADQAELNANEVAATQVKAGTRGRSIALRTVTKVVITNRAEAYAFFKDRPDFVQAINEVIQKFAEAEVKAGTVPAGVGVEKSQVAA